MIVASPRPIAAAPELVPLLQLRADEIQLHFQMAQIGMGIPAAEPDSSCSHTCSSAQLQYIVSEEHQNGDCSSSLSPLMSGDNSEQTPPPEYTRHPTCSYPFPDPTSSRATHPSSTSTSTSVTSSCSSSIMRPSSESFTTQSEHRNSQQQEQERKVQEMQQRESMPVQARYSLKDDLDSAPSYDSSFADTNLSGLPEQALSTFSLAREDLADLERASFTDLDDLDRSDNRADPDAIVQRRLTRNALLTRESAITLASASSIYSDTPASQAPRDSVYSTNDYDPARVSVQTYGSSVLTYGSRASQLLDEESYGNGIGSSRPVAPLPWLPRPSALDRIQHCGSHGIGGRARSESVGSSTCTGRRPLPPLPTPTSSSMSNSSPTSVITRDRSVSLPSRSNSSGSNYSVSSASSAAIGRRPRPLPRTPTSTVSTHLPDILEGEASEGVVPNSGPVRSNSMFLSPTSAAAPLNFRKRSTNYRYSTIGYGHLARAGMRGLFQHGNLDEEAGQTSEEAGTDRQRPAMTYRRAASRASTRSARSTFLVPDVEELVRILDSMDDGSGSGSGSNSERALATPLAGTWDPKLKKDADDEEALDMGSVLASSRSVVNVPCGEKRGAAAALGDLGVTKSIGLPTPAATPRNSPHRQAQNLPGNPKPETNPQTLPPQTQGHLQPKSTEDALSPAPSSATDTFSLTNFPMPPTAPLCIPAPGAIGAQDMPIPSAPSAIPPSPSLVDVGKNLAERATLPGIKHEGGVHKSQTSQKHISARAAIADLRSRISELPIVNLPTKKAIRKKLPSGVPVLGFPVPPHRRSQSVANTRTFAMTKRHPQPPAINVRVANTLPPPSSFSFGKSASSSSAPASNQFFDLDKVTIIYQTPAPAPPVAPLRIQRTLTRTLSSVRPDIAKVQIPPAASTPQSASAAQTTFSLTSTKQPPSAARHQRATSFCVTPSLSSPTVAPLSLRNTKPGLRTRSSTVGAIPSVLPKKQDQPKTDTTLPPMIDRKSSETDGSEESESDHLTTPTAPNAPIASVVEPTAEECRERDAGISVISDGSSFAAIQHANGTHVSLDPTFADIIKSMGEASEEEQMGSLLTIASSINTEHHASGYNAGFCLPIVDESRTHDDDGFVDVDDERNETGLERKEMVRKSISSSISSSEKRKSKTRSISSMKRRQSTRSTAAVRAAIRALPDPSTFPIPDSGGSVATNSSASAAVADFSGFGLRPSPLPKLRVVTKFKGGTVLLPASQAPLSATSTKSTMSTFGGHSRNASAVSLNAKRSSATGGIQRLNRLTLTDPRSPMNEATVAAARLVARMRQKRAALALRNRVVRGGRSHSPERSVIHIVRTGHARTGSGSSSTLRSKLKMSGGGFFGGTTVCALPNQGRGVAAGAHVGTGTDADADAVLRSGPLAHRPTIRRPRIARISAVLPKSCEVDLCA